jgi:hypothetical protein
MTRRCLTVLRAEAKRPPVSAGALAFSVSEAGNATTTKTTFRMPQ